jgi:hypothetical protein
MENKLNRYDFIKPMIKVGYSVVDVLGEESAKNLATILGDILGDSYA